MKKIISTLAFFLTIISMVSCTLNQPIVVKNAPVNNYKYVYISPTSSLTSSHGNTYFGSYYSSSKSINPSDLVSGFLSKKGFIRIPELKPELIDQTLIVNYGESGRRNIGLGYSIEVTIQLVSAKSYEPICSCIAEGMGDTEADDIRIAINRCMSALFSE